MLNKVFLVEDEIVTREGIRDNVDWATIGYEFCGEAADGETALRLIEETQPDVLITDIRMPFMDGLQLCRIVREQMPGLKIIILSGHDEFEYAQEAVKLGVTQYLLKPVGVRMLKESLSQVAEEIQREREKVAALQEMRGQLEENRSILRERFLIQLVLGDVTTPDAVERSRALDLNILARYYVVIVVRFEHLGTELDLESCKQAKAIVEALVEQHDDVLLFEKDLCELVLIIMGDSPEHLEDAGLLITQLFQSELEEKTRLTLSAGVGDVQSRISDIPESFTQALADLDHSSGSGTARTDRAELLKLDRSAVANYLRFGVIADYEAFNARTIRPLAETAQQSNVIKTVAMVDVTLTTARFVAELGGDVDTVDKIVPEINSIEAMLRELRTSEEFERQVGHIILSAMTYRDSVAKDSYGDIVRRAKRYVQERYSDPDLSLSDASAHVNLSPSYFSSVFSRENGTTFKEYVTSVRIQEAKALLRSTSLTVTEIGHRVGYKDPHYFSHVFRHHTEMTPGEYRRQSTIA